MCTLLVVLVVALVIQSVFVIHMSCPSAHPSAYCESIAKLVKNVPALYSRTDRLTVIIMRLCHETD